MAKSSFFKDGGSGSNVSATIQAQIDAAAAHAQAAANSFNSIGNELTLAQAARAGSETARDASVVAKNASESARDTAIQQASNAAGSASSAAASEGTAQAAETAAVASQNAAATSEGNAATSEQNAATSATASQTAQAASESARDASVVARTASETAKTASEAAQTASETARDASVVAKTASETAKTASEAARDLALSYRNTAETHKNDATTQAGIATTQAGTATTQAGNAQTSATSAATAQAAAESARDQALAAFDSFDDRMLGNKTANPNTDNDGNALVAGALYFNTSTSTMMLYTGSAWVAAFVSGGSFANLSGATFTGDVTVPNLITSGNVDGRDVSVDGAKLDGIAANATAVTSLTDLSITDGTNGQALKTDGNGNFSFGDVATSTAFTDITGKPNTLSGYGITDALANNAVGEIAADGVPFTANSTNSNAAKIGLEDNGTVRGYIGATSSLCFSAINSGAVAAFTVDQSGNAVSGSNFTASGNVQAEGGKLILGNDAYSTSVNYVGLTTNGMTGVNDYMIISGVDTYDLNTYVSAADGYALHLRGGGNYSTNEIVVPDGGNPAAREQFNIGTTSTLNSTGQLNLYRSANPFIAWYSGSATRGAYFQYLPSGDKLRAGDCNLESTGNVTAYASDERLKTDFATVENALEKVCALEGVTYKWDEEKCVSVGFKTTFDQTEIGLRAQQVQEQFPQIVTAAPFDLDEEGNSKSGDDYLTMRYERLVPVLIEAIKELKAEVDELKAGCCHGASD